MACKGDERKGELAFLPAKGLAGFLGNERDIQPCFDIGFSLLDYLTLVETLGQVVRLDKRGYILPTNNTILEQLNMNAEKWLKLSESFGGKCRCAVGSTKELESYAQHPKRTWVSG